MEAHERPAHDPPGTSSVPPTIVIVHRKERRSKCTIEPLKGRGDFRIVRYPLSREIAVSNYVRLSLDGPPLGPKDARRGLLVLDATWRLVKPMERDFADVEPRSLPAAVSAYPRSSKISPDPEGGLATIEALYLAYFLLGRERAGLLDHYRWGEEFLRINSQLVGPAE